jgi:Xaa-Pro aminopeptidase
MDTVSRRNTLIASLKGGLVVATAYDAVQLSGDMAAPFLQESGFYWLTSLDKPGWKVIIDGSRHHTTLVRPHRTDVEKVFDGDISDDVVKKLAQADEIISAQDFEARLRQLARKHTVVSTLSPKHDYHFVSNPASSSLEALLRRIFAHVDDCSAKVAELKAIKSDEELAVMRKSVALTRHAFEEIRHNLATYHHEYEIEADMTKMFRFKNAHHAYDPIVASGENAVTLHYIENNSRLHKTKPILIDVGARVGGYAADITRTYCVAPSRRVREIHGAVEKAHHDIIALLGPNLVVSDYMQQVDAIMKRALTELGLLVDKSDHETYRKYFPHAISHGLGIDVHDSLGSPRYFRPGMVLTVEPGIYIPEEGIGVRIEDDILITETGYENLSRGLSTAL